MIVVAVLTVFAIVYSSFSYKTTQKERFVEAITESDSLLSRSLLLINKQDSVSINQYLGNDIVIVFWSSWSDKSELLLNEIYTLKDQTDSLEVIAALVLDATDDIASTKFLEGFVHVDGASLFNDLKVVGIPSYILLDKAGRFKYAHVGYQIGAGYEVLRTQLKK